MKLSVLFVFELKNHFIEVTEETQCKVTLKTNDSHAKHL